MLEGLQSSHLVAGRLPVTSNVHRGHIALLVGTSYASEGLGEKRKGASEKGRKLKEGQITHAVRCGG